MEPCICGHYEDAHDSELGYCDARGCRCTGYVTESMMLEDDLAGDEDMPEELNFDDEA